MFSRRAPKRPGATAAAAAVRFWRERVRSERELRVWLERKGLEESEVSSAIRACQKRGLLDDSAAAELWALRAELDTTPPLAPGERSDLFATLGRAVAAVHAAEVVAVAELAAVSARIGDPG